MKALRVGAAILAGRRNRRGISRVVREVTLAARELLIEAIRRGRLDVAETFVIVDGSGKERGTLPLATLLPRASKRES